MQISGICLIAVGAWIKAKYRDFIQLSDSSSAASGAVFLIIIGVIVAIVGFLGCCGAWKENYCMVTTVLAQISPNKLYFCQLLLLYLTRYNCAHPWIILTSSRDQIFIVKRFLQPKKQIKSLNNYLYVSIICIIVVIGYM